VGLVPLPFEHRIHVAGRQRPVRIGANAQIRDVIRDLTPGMKDTGGDQHDIAFRDLAGPAPLRSRSETRADQNRMPPDAEYRKRVGISEEAE